MQVAQYKSFQWRWTVFIALGLTMIGMGASVQNVSGPMDMLSIIFVLVGGMMMMTGLVYLLPSANSLAIEENGFSYRHGLKTTFCQWEDCGEFSTWQQKLFGMKAHELVAFDSKNPKSDAKTNIKVTGKNTVLPGTYGLEANELAENMNHFRSIYLGRKQAMTA